jgi:tetratricopeptide (TPR) repeat protein
MNHPNAIESRMDLANVWFSMQDFVAAEKPFREGTDMFKSILGPYHSATLDAMKDLTRVLNKAGKRDEAKDLWESLLLNFDSASGSDGLALKVAASQLADLLHQQGRYEEAISVQRRYLEEPLQSSDHGLRTLSNLEHFAANLMLAAQYGEAMSLYDLVYEQLTRILGADARRTRVCHVGKANVMQYLGKYSEAVQIYREHLDYLEKSGFAKSVSYMATLSNLGSVLIRQHKYEDAEDINRQAVSLKEEKLGISHENTMTSVTNLALCLSNLGKVKETEEMSQRAVKGYEDHLGEEHPHTLTSYSALAVVLGSQKKYEQSPALHEKVVAGNKKILGSLHPNYLASLALLSHVLDIQSPFRLKGHLSEFREFQHLPAGFNWL